MHIKLFTPHRSRGFTLIELSIVLVIVALLVGGVLAGKMMIENAYMRADSKTVESYSTAINAFKLKYGYLPGDVPNPTKFGFDSNAAGNGDGVIQGTIPSYSYFMIGYMANSQYPEWIAVVHELGTAKLIDLSGDYVPNLANYAANVATPGISYPAMKTNRGDGTDFNPNYRPGIVVFYEASTYFNQHSFRFGFAPYSSSPSTLGAFQGALSPAAAKLYDNKFDDGVATSGNIRIGPMYDQCANDIYSGFGNSCGYGGVGLVSDYPHCALSSTGDYDTTYPYRVCSLRVKASF